MLQSSLVAGLILSSHPGLDFPSVDLQSTARCLWPSPQETEHYREEMKIESVNACMKFKVLAVRFEICCSYSVSILANFVPI